MIDGLNENKKETIKGGWSKRGILLEGKMVRVG